MGNKDSMLFKRTVALLSYLFIVPLWMELFRSHLRI